MKFRYLISFTKPNFDFSVARTLPRRLVGSRFPNRRPAPSRPGDRLQIARGKGLFRSRRPLPKPDTNEYRPSNVVLPIPVQNTATVTLVTVPASTNTLPSPNYYFEVGPSQHTQLTPISTAELNPAQLPFLYKQLFV